MAVGVVCLCLPLRARRSVSKQNLVNLTSNLEIQVNTATDLHQQDWYVLREQLTRKVSGGKRSETSCARARCLVSALFCSAAPGDLQFRPKSQPHQVSSMPRTLRCHPFPTSGIFFVENKTKPPSERLPPLSFRSPNNENVALETLNQGASCSSILAGSHPFPPLPSLTQLPT